MKKFLHSITLIEVIVIVAVVFFFSGIAYFAILGHNNPNTNYKYDALTDTTTWDDEDGNKFMKSPDGSVRQIK